MSFKILTFAKIKNINIMAKKTTTIQPKETTKDDVIKALEDVQVLLLKMSMKAIYPPRYVRASREIDGIKRRLAK